MEEVVKDWLFDPAIGKFIASVLVVLVVFTVVRYSQRVLGHYVEDAQRRYRLRKLITFFG